MGCEESQLIKSQDQIDLDSRIEDKRQGFTIAYRQFIANTRGNIFQLYYFTTVLNKTHSKVITKAIHKTNYEQRICKIIPFQKINHLLAMMEVQILKNLEHPNIVKVHQFFIQKSFLFIIFQCCKGQPLIEELSRVKNIDHNQIVSLMKQLLLVLNYCEKNQIAHRNIKPSHIVVHIQEKSVELKLIDFSYAENIKNPKKKIITSVQEPYLHSQSVEYPCQNDVYCCGLILFSILSMTAIPSMKRSETIEKVHQFMSENEQYLTYKDLLLKLLNPNPILRVKAGQALNDPLFQQKTERQDKIKIYYDNLKDYNVKGRLKTILWMHATINLKNFTTPQLVMQFHNLDQNRDGKIDLGQLSEGIANVYNYDKFTAIEEAKNIFDKLDKNQNGFLDFYEFAMGSSGLRKQITSKELQILFKELDKNNDGKISVEELNTCIEDIDDLALLEISSSTLNFQEFKSLMQTYATRLSQHFQNKV